MGREAISLNVSTDDTNHKFSRTTMNPTTSKKH